MNKRWADTRGFIWTDNSVGCWLFAAAAPGINVDETHIETWVRSTTGVEEWYELKIVEFGERESLEHYWLLDCCDEVEKRIDVSIYIILYRHITQLYASWLRILSGENTRRWHRDECNKDLILVLSHKGCGSSSVRQAVTRVNRVRSWMLLRSEIKVIDAMNE
jgi:hypothetical protein